MLRKLMKYDLKYYRKIMVPLRMYMENVVGCKLVFSRQKTNV